MTCNQAKLALSGFSARAEQVRAAALMLAALENPQHLHTVVSSLAPEAQEQARSRPELVVLEGGQLVLAPGHLSAQISRGMHKLDIRQQVACAHLALC